MSLRIEFLFSTKTNIYMDDYQQTFDVSLDTMLKNAQEQQGE